MPKRSKRLAKGIDSIGRQIELHERKLREAEKAGNLGLVKYYEKELQSLRKAITRKAAAIKK
ncbi:MAG: hypothetical protein V1813_01760 [Candidatus Aenigmatarchaeota archaeon]